MRNILILLALLCITFNLEARETRKKIVVLDTGIHVDQLYRKYLCKNGVVSVANNDGSASGYLRGYQAHGQNVVGLIGSRINTEKFCIVSIRVYSWNLRAIGYLEGLEYAYNLTNVVAVNVSTSSTTTTGHTSYIMKEHAKMLKLVQKGVKIHVAAGNDSLILKRKTCGVYPACLKPFFDELGYSKYFTVVSSKTTSESNWATSFITQVKDGHNKGKPPMSGSSQATAIYTGEEFSK